MAMAPIARFEDLIAWQKSRVLAQAIVEVTRSGRLAAESGLRRQMREAAASIPSNIAEGFERGGRGEFHQFLSTAKGSCAELRTQLYLALDAGLLDQATFKILLEQAEEVARIIGGLRAAVNRQRTKS
jgi:four helix bundle protein